MGRQPMGYSQCAVATTLRRSALDLLIFSFETARLEPVPVSDPRAMVVAASVLLATPWLPLGYPFSDPTLTARGHSWPPRSECPRRGSFAWRVFQWTHADLRDLP